jgi:hypothetical protein
MGNVDPTKGPAAIHRGGHFGSGTDAGVFAIEGDNPANQAADTRGFRCRR